MKIIVVLSNCVLKVVLVLFSGIIIRLKKLYMLWMEIVFIGLLIFSLLRLIMLNIIRELDIVLIVIE